jgi:hypothetical protein
VGEPTPHTDFFGLDEFGLLVLGMAVASCIWKLVALAFATTVWPTQRGAAVVFLVTWIAALAASAGVMNIAVGAILPMPPTSAARLAFLVAGWIGFDIVACLLPAALMRPDAWTSPRSTATTPVVSTAAIIELSAATTVAPQRPHASAPVVDRSDLLTLLAGLNKLPHQEAARQGVLINTDGSLTTSQAVLAVKLGVSKGTINRQLRTLAAESRIVLKTSASETRIQLV